MTKQSFDRAKKVGQSILTAPEKAPVAWGTPKIPEGIETYHLTILTLAWSILNVLFGYLGKSDIHWLWMVYGTHKTLWELDMGKDET